MGIAALRRRIPAFAAGLASLAIALGAAAIPAEAAPQARDVDYVALGDSYTAGIGAGPYDATETCIQTSGGYVDMVGKTGRVDLLVNAACSGAELAGGPTSVAAQLSDPKTLAALSDAELVSITAGANDLGFAQIIGICATLSPTDCENAVRAATSEASLHALTLALAGTYKAIQAAAPDAKIVVLGYPLLFDTTDPAVTLPIPLASQKLINFGTIAINGAIEDAVSFANNKYGTNAVYVDVTNRFAGHEVNSGDPWIFFAAYVNATGTVQLDPRSFHPNEDGHRAYASALLASVKLGQLVRS
ncbi:SGNH/GDSL hydrolase family protein [Arthrobacter sp. B1I2]|uniref:SGNH/GDSL hydrolase family protein n=1 Tax=Arthrobacter sp. B1I2 TaxID=3042263 RepID=UPI00278915E9|nr:SGNH/GDSL hydrolase family protein [Arthrobacter sp. B1I2]MDQ0730991.1 lysophospholipase L1-like esterase [Arthrobacter sp. B1I2]